jgi:hypothetical protein
MPLSSRMVNRQSILTDLLALRNVPNLLLEVEDISLLVLSGVFVRLYVANGTEGFGSTYTQMVVNHNVDRLQQKWEFYLLSIGRFSEGTHDMAICIPELNLGQDASLHSVFC